jgi:hypothetical protein
MDEKATSSKVHSRVSVSHNSSMTNIRLNVKANRSFYDTMDSMPVQVCMSRSRTSVLPKGSDYMHIIFDSPTNKNAETK